MILSICIRTVKRNPDYLGSLLQRLAETGTLTHPLVKGVHVSNGEGITPNENGCRALLMAAADQPEWIVFFEDDMDIIDDFVGSTLRWLSRYERPDIHFYPLGCQYSQCFPPGADHWRYDISKFYQTGGLLFRASHVPHFVEFMRTRPPVSPYHRCFDLNMARWHQEIEPRTEYLLTPVPCFVDHLGHVSSMGCNVGSFAGFAGRNYSYGV